MKARIVIVSGACGTGKISIARLLAEIPAAPGQLICTRTTFINIYARDILRPG